MEQFIKRFQSFLWRLGGAIVTFSLVWIAENIGILELPLWVQGTLALILGEVTKYWNTYQASRGKNFVGGQLEKEELE